MGHPYHIVELSPWPVLLSLSVLGMPVGFLMWVTKGQSTGLLYSFICTLIVVVLWIRDITRESTLMGKHTKAVQKGLMTGFILFIASEVMLFFSVFWAYFASSLVPTPQMGCSWPPIGVNMPSPWGIPLLGTLILLSSGATVTWSHSAIMSGHMKETLISLSWTIVLASLFLYCQLSEYSSMDFCISDSVFGSVFYFSTGLHGCHVLVGTIMLISSMFMCYMYHYTASRHLSFIASIWYWHFVDVVWLFLYVVVYCWGSF